jgi:predicted lipoprotein with Yx(FWY)xxD motif
MGQMMKWAVPVLVASLLVAACGSSAKSSTSIAASSNKAPTTSSGSGPSTVHMASNPRLGTAVLTNARGLTLYHLSAEVNGRFICAGSCLQLWHPLKVKSGTQPTGSVGSLGTIKRPDGGEQVTFRGEPLYLFVQDQSRGDVKGQGFKDVGTWSAATASVNSATVAPVSTPSSGVAGY